MEPKWSPLQSSSAQQTRTQVLHISGKNEHPREKSKAPVSQLMDKCFRLPLFQNKSSCETELHENEPV